MQVRKADLGKPDLAARTVPLVLATDYPVQRSGYVEVLDVGRVDLSRGDLPLIESHDAQRLNIGVIRSIRAEGGKLRGLAVFGTSARASEVLADVQAGIVTGVSIGYQLTDEGLPLKLRDGTEAISFGFLPYECSLVAVPADPNAGFNRAAQTLTLPRKSIMNTQTNHGSQSAAEIIALGEAHANRGGVELAMKFIRERRGLEEFRETLLDHVSQPARQPITDTVTFDMTRGVEYSMLRAVDAAITGDWRKAGFEREMSQEMARTYGRQPRGIFVPFGQIQSRVMSTGGSTTGQALVPTMHSGFIEMLRNSARVLEAGATVMRGLQGNVDIPRQTAGATAEWVAEDGAVTPSDMSFNSVTLTPKTCGALLSWTRRMTHSSVPEMESLARADLAAQIGLAMDRAALHGLGSSNQPTGIYAASNVNSVSMGGGVPTFGKLIDMAAALGTDNALQGNLAFLTTPGMAGKLAQTVVAASTDTRMIWEGPLAEGKLAGYNAYSTGQVSATLGAGAEHGLILGDFSQMIVGIWGGGVDILVDPYTDADRGRVRITAFLDMDIALRHPESFCKATGATIA